MYKSESWTDTPGQAAGTRAGPCRIPQESAAHANRQATYFILAKLLFSLLAAGFTAHSTGEIAEWG